MGKRYKEPPIAEALCEFQFMNTDPPWDITLIGLMYDTLKSSFPKKLSLSLNMAVAATSQYAERPGNTPLLPLIRFSHTDKNKLVQLGQNLLTVNHLKPYNSWKEFLSVIERVYSSYLEVAEPKRLRHLALKYINRIEVPKANNTVETLFHLRPLLPKDLPENIEAFLMGVNLPSEDAEDILRVQLGTIKSDTLERLAFTLEITYIFSHPEKIPLGEALLRLDIAHKQIQKVFEACLTNQLKHILGEVKE